MRTGLHWLAYSERERQHAMDIAQSLQQRESRDELGPASIRMPWPTCLQDIVGPERAEELCALLRVDLAPTHVLKNP